MTKEWPDKVLCPDWGPSATPSAPHLHGAPREASSSSRGWSPAGPPRPSGRQGAFSAGPPEGAVETNRVTPRHRALQPRSTACLRSLRASAAERPLLQPGPLHLRFPRGPTTAAGVHPSPLRLPQSPPRCFLLVPWSGGRDAGHLTLLGHTVGAQCVHMIWPVALRFRTL